MSEVERFECMEPMHMYNTSDDVNKNWGSWVKASDYDAVAAERDALRNFADLVLAIPSLSDAALEQLRESCKQVVAGRQPHADGERGS